MIRFLIAVAQAIAQFLASSVNATIAFLDWLAGKLSGGGTAPAAPIPDLKMALPDADRVEKAAELQKAENKAVDVLLQSVLTPAQQAITFASLPVEDRGIADLGKLTAQQIDWLYSLNEDQLVILKGSSERRVAAALAGKPQSLMAIPSVGEEPYREPTVLARRLEAKRAASLLAAPVITYEAVRI